MEYDEFIKGKVKKDMTYGFDIDDSDIHPLLFDFQREVVKWAVKKGRCAIFQDCGLGKALRHGTPVLTNSGWKNIENLSLDDKVMGSDLSWHDIKGIYPQGIREIYRVTFNGGEFIDCDGDHLWSVLREDCPLGSMETKTTLELKGDIAYDGISYLVPLLGGGYLRIAHILYTCDDYATCISVDSPDHLFVTKNYVLTHNTIQQLEWARHIHQKTNGKILILTPLAVAQQTVREGKKIDLKVNVCKRQSDVVDGINVTNYEKLHHFDPKQFIGVVADESGILKNFGGTVRKEIQAFADDIPYRLACSATPSPNDFMEIGTQSEFLGYMSRNEMLAEFFINDMKETQKWRLKKHAEGLFWEWMSMWCVAMQKPSDLGYEDRGFLLPELVVEYDILDVDNFEDSLAPCETLNDRRRARKKSLKKRVTRAAEIANNYDGPVLLWCDLNDESSMLADVINDSVEVAGRHTNEYKEKAMMDFSDGKIKAMISKSVIAGFGMNWQHCSRMIFVGLSDSYEQMYQAIRRCWRFGQKSKVHVTVIIGEMEVNVLHNIQRKEQAAQRMFRALIDCLNKHGMNRKMLDVVRYNPTEKMMLPNWL